MGTTTDKLQYLIDAKNAISAAIEAKGGTVPTELSGYGPAIEALPSGGGGDNRKLQSLVDRSITSISSSDLGNITSIGDYAFGGCSSLNSITIPDGVTYIGHGAFRVCSSLSSITIPTGVTFFGNYIFYDCRSLTSVAIPDAVTSIGQYAFASCSKLTSITIPDSVTSIGEQAFSLCSGLTSITIGKGVTRIEYSMFYGCSNCLIYDFSNHTSVPTLAGTSAFSRTNANKKIIVPDDLYDSWKAANNWKSTTNGIVGAITKASEA